MERLTRRAVLFGREKRVCCVSFMSKTCESVMGYCTSCPVNENVWERLAELEDKLESGELVEVVRCKDCGRIKGCDIYKHFGSAEFYCKHGIPKEKSK